MKLYQITAKHFCAGVIVEEDKIIKAAPILAWSIGKSWRWFDAYCTRRMDWKVVNCNG
jgi:hypothetical protein